MPIYRVQCGDMDVEIETGAEATAKAVAIIAIDREMPETMGRLISISGGQFVGDNETYLSTTKLCEEMGIRIGVQEESTPVVR